MKNARRTSARTPNVSTISEEMIQQLEEESNATQTVLTSNGGEYIEGEMSTIAELETALDKVAAGHEWTSYSGIRIQ